MKKDKFLIYNRSNCEFDMGPGTRLVGLLTILVGIVLFFMLPLFGLFLGGLLIIVGFILLIPELVAAIIVLGIIIMVFVIVFSFVF